MKTFYVIVMRVDRDKCIKCGGCVAVCPVGALELLSGITCDEKKCIKCRACIKFCPLGAISEG